MPSSVQQGSLRNRPPRQADDGDEPAEPPPPRGRGEELRVRIAPTASFDKKQEPQRPKQNRVVGGAPLFSQRQVVENALEASTGTTNLTRRITSNSDELASSSPLSCSSKKAAAVVAASKSCMPSLVKGTVAPPPAGTAGRAGNYIDNGGRPFLAEEEKKPDHGFVSQKDHVPSSTGTHHPVGRQDKDMFAETVEGDTTISAVAPRGAAGRGRDKQEHDYCETNDRHDKAPAGVVRFLQQLRQRVLGRAPSFAPPLDAIRRRADENNNRSSNNGSVTNEESTTPAGAGNDHRHTRTSFPTRSVSNIPGAHFIRGPQQNVNVEDDHDDEGNIDHSFTAQQGGPAVVGTAHLAGEHGWRESGETPPVVLQAIAVDERTIVAVPAEEYADNNNSEKIRRYKLMGMVACVVAAAAVLVLVTVMVMAAKRSSSPAPSVTTTDTPSPTVSPTITTTPRTTDSPTDPPTETPTTVVPALTSDPNCSNELNSLLSCSNGQLNGQDCITCYSNSIPELSVVGCQNITDQFCSVFETCHNVCGYCVEEATDLFGCSVASSLNITAEESCFSGCPNTSPGGAGGGGSFCTAEQYTVNSCLSSLSSAEACVNCYNNAKPDSAFNCADIEDQFCAGMENCEVVCGICFDEVVGFFDCSVDFIPYLPDCTVNCPYFGGGGSAGGGAGGGGSVCPAEASAADSCLSSLSTVEECVSCYSDAIPETASTCADIEDQFCAGMANCEHVCGICFDEVVEYFDCMVDFLPGFPNCDVDCLINYGEGLGGGSGVSATPPQSRAICPTLARVALALILVVLPTYFAS